MSYIERGIDTYEISDNQLSKQGRRGVLVSWELRAKITKKRYNGMARTHLQGRKEKKKSYPLPSTSALTDY